ncbi:MAG: hypothetical protein DSM106950_36015 [Stigonema ocellatum SAG 48.90 = DSM 106950]|nr:hypothetical protein [Stigonema ocellatum SAG 48.90 = DSM 106950]
MGSGEWGVGSGEWGVGSGEWGVGSGGDSFAPPLLRSQYGSDKHQIRNPVSWRNRVSLVTPAVNYP